MDTVLSPKVDDSCLACASVPISELNEPPESTVNK